jgi:hypothetical protein
MTQHATGASSRAVSHEPVRAACSRVMHSLSETIVARGGAEAGDPLRQVPRCTPQQSRRGCDGEARRRRKHVSHRNQIRETAVRCCGRYQACAGSGWEEMGARMTYLQIRARMSPLPVAKTPPVGLGATEMTTKN